MTNVTSYNPFLDSYSEITYNLVEALRHRRYIPVYFGEKKFFFFMLRGKLQYISELNLSLILGMGSYLGTLFIRYLIRRYKFKKKIKDFILRLKIKNLVLKLNRGGDYGLVPAGDEFSDFAQVQNELILKALLDKLNFTERYIKGVFRKCVEPGLFYEITNSDIKNIAQKMVVFARNEGVRVISQEVFLLAFVSAMDSGIMLLHGNKSLKSTINLFLANHLTEKGPAISLGLGVIQAIVGGYSFPAAIIGLIKVSSITWSSIAAIERFRNFYTINCLDFVRELSFFEKNSVPASSNNLGNQVSLHSNSKLITEKGFYLRTYPDQNAMFMETSSGLDLSYQIDPVAKGKDLKNFEIKTLEGKWKSLFQVDGQVRLEWFKDKKRITKDSAYISLNKRTKTLMDVARLDGSNSRESAQKISDQVQRERTLAKFIMETVDDMI